MNSSETHKGGNAYLFQVEVMVNAETNGDALEKLLHALNAGKFADYRVTSGIELGREIETALKRAKPPSNQKPAASSSDKEKISAALAKAKQETKAKSPPPGESSPKKTAPSSPELSDELQKRIQSYIDSNKLLRLNVNKGRGIKLSIPCRIIGYDAGLQLITVYHVDEKQVYSLKLFEIDDFIE